jgi:hypothetical protein
MDDTFVCVFHAETVFLNADRYVFGAGLGDGDVG